MKHSAQQSVESKKQAHKNEEECDEIGIASAISHYLHYVCAVSLWAVAKKIKKTG